MKLYILLVSLLSASITYGQDSARSRNDKPGTPQSLRTTDKSPVNQVHVINPNIVPNQAINHGATENSKVNTTDNNKVNTVKQPVIVTNDHTGISPVSQTPAATLNQSTNKSAMANDTSTNNVIN